jgi:hypothetical protein
MRKFLLFFSFILILATVITSCSSSKTYAELLQDEKDNIAQLLADSGYHVIPFNKDTLYNPKTKKFMKMDNGAYIAIISRGDTNDMAVKDHREVLSRFKYGRILTNADTTAYSNNQSDQPLKYYYGNSTAYFVNQSSGGLNVAATCEAIQKPLEFLGNGAKIKIIIPAKISYTDFQSSVKTIYYPYYSYQFY